MKVQTTYALGYTAYADYEDFTISYHKEEMPAHDFHQYASQAEMEAGMVEVAPMSDWTETEDEE